MDIVVVVGALIVSFLVFTWLVKVVRATFRTALFVALILLVLQVVFGIGPATLWEQILTWLPGVDPASNQ